MTETFAVALVPLHVRQRPHGRTQYVKKTLRLPQLKTRTRPTLKGARPLSSDGGPDREA